jgi:hypothetical protein
LPDLRVAKETLCLEVIGENRPLRELCRNRNRRPVIGAKGILRQLQFSVVNPPSHSRSFFHAKRGEVSMLMRRITKVGLTLVLVGALIQAIGLLWVSTRHWTPVDIPITLSPGEIISKEFKINSSALYFIQVVAQKNLPFDTLNCLLGTYGIWGTSFAGHTCEESSVIDATWTLSSRGHVIANDTSNTFIPDGWTNLYISKGLGSFQGEYGRSYKLEVHFLKDGRRLAGCNPHLTVWVSGEWMKGIQLMRAASILLTAVLWLIGIPLLLISVVRRLRQKVAASEERPVSSE